MCVWQANTTLKTGTLKHELKSVNHIIIIIFKRGNEAMNFIAQLKKVSAPTIIRKTKGPNLVNILIYLRFIDCGHIAAKKHEELLKE